MTGVSYVETAAIRTAVGSKAKPALVGEFPCATCATADADGGAHAHGIYLAPGGAGGPVLW